MLEGFPTSSDLPEGVRCLGTIDPPSSFPALRPDDIRAALASPCWPDGATEPGLYDLIRPGESVCFVISDYTRKTATDLVLPVIVQELKARGCSVEDMRVLVASGIHRKPTTEELRYILGPEAWLDLGDKVVLHDPDDESALTTVGTTKRGHTVRVNRLAVASDRLIPIGAAIYHYHAGFGGGRKSLVPGIASRDTIAHNHSLTLDRVEDRIHPMVGPGILDGNPVAEEMLESARLCEPDAIVNTVLSPAGDLVGVFCGELDAAHRAACSMLEKVARINVEEAADIVIASAAGAPNWIQSHKALYNAHRAVKKDGRIILMAPCPEGIGDERFRYWVKKADITEIYDELRSSPEVNGQTALSTKTKGKITTLVTDMSSSDIAELGIDVAENMDAALSDALAGFSARGVHEPTCYLMPRAMYTVPFLGQGAPV
jgi:nickel-dependent lactate racemase